VQPDHRSELAASQPGSDDDPRRGVGLVYGTDGKQVRLRFDGSDLGVRRDPEQIKAVVQRMENVAAGLTLDGDRKDFREAGRKW
jgi:hypothetical protein